jgi:hypothetical protein
MSTGPSTSPAPASAQFRAPAQFHQLAKPFLDWLVEAGFIVAYPDCWERHAFLADLVVTAAAGRSSLPFDRPTVTAPWHQFYLPEVIRRVSEQRLHCLHGCELDVRK